MFSPIRSSHKKEQALNKLSDNLTKSLHNSPMPRRKSSDTTSLSTPVKKLQSFNYQKTKLRFQSFKVCSPTSLLVARAKRYFIRSVSLSKPQDGSNESKLISSFMKSFCHSEKKKFLSKILQKLSLDIQPDVLYYPQLLAIIKRSRGVKSFEYHHFCNGAVSLVSSFLKMVKLISTKSLNTIAIHTTNTGYGIPSRKLHFIQLIQYLKKLKIRSLSLPLSLSNKLFNFITHPPMNKSVPLENRELIIKWLSKLPSLRILELTPSSDLLFIKTSNKYLSQIENLYVNGFRSALQKDDFENSSFCLKNLKSFELEITIKDFLTLFQKVINESSRLKKLSLNIHNTTVVIDRRKEYRSLFPEGFSALWDQVNKFMFLEEFVIIHKDLTKPDTPTSSPLIPIKHIGVLKHMRHLAIHTNHASTRMLVSFADLGAAISNMSKLRCLSIKSYVTNKALTDFFRSDSYILTQIEELDFHFELFEEVKIGKEFIEWMKPKQKIESFSFMLGTKGDENSLTVITSESLNNTVYGIMCIEKLKYLKLCLGMNEFSKKGKNKTNFSGLNESDSYSILASLVQALPYLRKLIIQMGVGYFTDDNLSSIIYAIKAHHKISDLALGGNFKKLSSKNFCSIFYTFLKMESYRLRNVIFQPYEYLGVGSEVIETVKKLILKYFGQEPKNTLLEQLEL